MYVNVGYLHSFYMNIFLDILVEANVRYIRLVLAFSFYYSTYIFSLFKLPKPTYIMCVTNLLK